MAAVSEYLREWNGAFIAFQLLQTTFEISIYVEYTALDGVEQILKRFHEKRIRVLNMEITNAAKSEHHNASVIFFSASA